MNKILVKYACHIPDQNCTAYLQLEEKPPQTVANKCDGKLKKIGEN